MQFSNTAIITFFLGILALVASGFVLFELRTILLPFALALLLSLLLKPVLLQLRRWHIPSSVAIITALALVGGILFGMGYVLTKGVQEILADAPRYQERLNALLLQADTFVKDISGGELTIANTDWKHAVDVSTLTNVLTSSLSSVLSAVGNGILILFYLIFLLTGSEEFPAKLEAAFPAHRSAHLRQMLESVNKNIRKYMAMKTLVNILTGGVVWLILIVFGVDFALFLGVVAGLLHYIPNIGSFIGTALPALIIILQFDSLGLSLLIIGLLVVAQNLIGNIIEPKLLERSLNLSPLVILLSLIFWGWLWGIVGMILAVPLASIAKIICENIPSLQPIAMLMSRGVSEPANISAPMAEGV